MIAQAKITAAGLHFGPKGGVSGLSSRASTARGTSGNKAFSLEDKVEDLRHDADTASMEVEELHMELEDTQQANEAGASGGADGTAEENISALSVHNAWLREALIRLREQSSRTHLPLAPIYNQPRSRRNTLVILVTPYSF